MKTPGIFFLLLLFCLAALSNAANFAEFHVSPAGTGDYSSASPGLLSGVRARVQSINSAMTGDVVVYLHAGTYFLDSTFTLRTEDGGKNGFDVVYKAFETDTPVISGGKNISGGWTLYDAAKNIYRKQGVNWSFRQLFVNGDWAIRARSPNQVSGIQGAGYYTLSGPYPYSIDTANIGSWANNGVCELVWVNHWSQYRARILDYSVSNRLAAIRFQSPESNLILDHHYQSSGFGYFENAYELIDAGGEWFLDTSAHALFYKPRQNEEMATANVIAPAVEKLIYFKGTGSVPVSHIRFQGITFMHGNWTIPDRFGYVSMQGGQVYQSSCPSRATDIRSASSLFSPAAGMVTVEYGQNLRVERCIFKNSGAWGVMEHAGSSTNSYVGNRFQRLASGAITLGNILSPSGWDYIGPQGSALFDTVSNNYIEETGYYYNDAVGIMALRVQHLVIEHNEVANVPYSGISIGFFWSDAASADSCNRIRFNKITGAMSLLDDGAGIYTLERMDNTIFEGNYIRNISRSRYSGGYGVVGMYLDNGSCYKTIIGNVLENVPEAFYSGNSPNHDNLFRHNFMNCPQGGIAPDNTVDSNTVISGSVWPAQAKAIMDFAGLTSAYTDIRPVVPPKTSSLLLRLTFNESAGLTAFDSSGNGYDGMFTSGTWVAGRLGNGLRVDGSHAVAMPGPVGPMPAFTVVFWINPNSHSDYNQSLGNDWGRFVFHTTVSGAIYCGTDINTRFSPSELPSGTLELNSWQHFVYTFDNGNAKFYKNGVKLAEKPQAIPQDWNGFELTTLDGIIDELRIYDTALDSATVSVLAQGRDSLFMDLSAQQGLAPLRIDAATPFFPSTSIAFNVPENGKAVNLAIYTLDGRLISQLFHGEKPMGNYRIRWNATGLPSGLYLCRIMVGKKHVCKKLVLMR